MLKKHIITVGGLPGSGKSSTSDKVAEMLGYRRFSSGDFLRAIASKHNVSIDELNRLAESDPSYDQEVDDMIKTIGQKEELVIDSRLAFHWIPESFKVFLKVDLHAAAKRTFIHIREVGRVSQTAESLEEVYHKLVARIDSERKRYEVLYDGLDYTDEAGYDFVVDTTNYSLDEVAVMITDAYTAWLEENKE